MKRGGSHGGRTNWKRRWFTLIGDELFYFEARGDGAPRGRIVLADRDFRAADEEVGKPHAIGIYNRHDLAEAPFYCCSESAADTAAWLEKLHAAAQGTYRLVGAAAGDPARELERIAAAVQEYEPVRLQQAEVELTVVEARGIAAMDPNGLSDPYCVVHCAGNKTQTRCIPKTLRPKWHETFTFAVSRAAAQLQVDVYDRDFLGGDDFLGVVMLPLAQLLQACTPDGGGRPSSARASSVSLQGSGGKTRERAGVACAHSQDMWHTLERRTARDDHVTGELRLRVRVTYDQASLPQGGLGSVVEGGGESGDLPANASTEGRVRSSLANLKAMHSAAQRAMLAVTAERNTLHAGLAELFDDPSFAALKSRASRTCVLRVSELEAKGGGGGAADAFRDASALVCVVTLGGKQLRTEVMKTAGGGAGSARGSCYWDDVALELPIASWNDEVTIALLDASPKAALGRGGGRELGAATLRLLELGDVPDRRHDTWLTLQHGGGASGGGDGGGGGGGPSVRVCCSWAFKNAGKAKSSRQLLDGAASSDPLADARLVVAALRAQIAAQEERVDKLHGLFDALKGEFEPEYVTYCAKVAGYVTLTVGAATDLPAASAADHFVVVSHGAGCCATRPVARGDGWDETFELAIANTHEPLVISIKASAWPRAKLVGVIRVALDTLLDQQPRSKREPFAETGKEDAPPKLGFKVAYRDAGADGRLGRLDRSMTKDGGHRYDRLLRALRQPSLWLAVALSEGVGIEDGDEPSDETSPAVTEESGAERVSFLLYECSCSW